MQIQHNIQLQNLNTMATPSVAKWFVVIQQEKDIPQALAFCQQQACDFLVLGEGSNSVFTSDLDVLVIANRIGGAAPIPNLFRSNAIEIVNQTSVYCDLKVGAGVPWHNFVEQSLQQGLYGLERLALIPGLVGAAPIQNIGAYGSEVKDVILSVHAFDIENNKFVEMTTEDCQFAYRDSVFKRQANRYIISHVTLRLQKQSTVFNLNEIYPALQNALSACDEIRAQEIFNTVCEVRQSKLPNPKEIPNTGSFFKNPVVTDEAEQQLKAKYPNLVSYCVEGGKKLAAGWLIEQAGLKGFAAEQGVGCYEKQALVITNPNKASGKQVLAFAQHVQATVQSKFGVDLEIEPRLYSTNRSSLDCLN